MNPALTFRKLDISELDIALEILNQEPFASHDNYNTKKTEINWLTKLLNHGYAFALVLDNTEIVSVVFAEDLIGDGVMLWLIVTSPNHQNKNYGTILLLEFEQYVKGCGKTWIYLDSTEESLNFYRKNSYGIKPYCIYECYKEL